MQGHFKVPREGAGILLAAGVLRKELRVVLN